ncbi:pyridoxal-phosphate dependent enzyme [Mucilaginibacter roseus]|uniref:Pyridoxal-phosphate dependent enzyme n=1 Tax=Mucilaginibacter roseus TaxID=1528868 RepID=A0ABS8U5P5_9SPHI|nr:pyridoxal-phosphate dependent enzyme [Mucilaginibacter roseus]MCD8741627.1 pyridoxal-phosphate dependent enzyme [Mucilaginibacter roseus]
MRLDLEIHSPLEEVNLPAFTKHGVRVFVKRDDLIHPLISGNKWRKLKYLLKKADAESKQHLVTFGGAYSNHLLATAAAAAKFGFKATGFVRGEEVQNDTLLLCRLHGMQLIFTSRESYRDKAALFNNHFAGDTNAFFIDEGGASPEAALGCSELVDELPFAFDHVFCACGTGTTAAGIINGLNKHQLKTQFHAIPALKNGNFLRNDIDKFLTHPHPFHLHNQYHFGGYAKTTPKLIGFIKTFTAATGILIEPVYTGKMLYALVDMVKQGEFASGSRILAVHTGGIMGLFGMANKF